MVEICSVRSEEEKGRELSKPGAEQVLSPPPDGGITAWAQVFGSFWIWFNT